MFNSARTTPDTSAHWSRQWHEVFSVRVDGSEDRLSESDRRAGIPVGSHESGNSEVFVANVDGTSEINVSKSAAFDGWPSSWSPDGNTIAFTSNRAGPANVGQIFLVNADGTGLRQLTVGPLSHAQPAWSSDGRRVYAYQLTETNACEFGDIVVIEFSLPKG